MNDLISLQPDLKKVILHFENFENNLALKSIYDIKSSEIFDKFDIEQKMVLYGHEIFTNYQLLKFKNFFLVFNEEKRFFLKHKENANNLAQLLY